MNIFSLIQPGTCTKQLCLVTCLSVGCGSIRLVECGLPSKCGCLHILLWSTSCCHVQVKCQNPSLWSNVGVICTFQDIRFKPRSVNSHAMYHLRFICSFFLFARSVWHLFSHAIHPMNFAFWVLTSVQVGGGFIKEIHSY